jgi:hypothetical protein
MRVTEITPGKPVASLKVEEVLSVFDLAGIGSKEISTNSWQETF